MLQTQNLARTWFLKTSYFDVHRVTRKKNEQIELLIRHICQDVNSEAHKPGRGSAESILLSQLPFPQGWHWGLAHIIQLLTLYHRSHGAVTWAPDSSVTTVGASFSLFIFKG